jgi:predicted transcriptional regulator
MEEDLLTLDTRRRLYEAVRRAPGSGAREVQRAAGTAWGETVYHLDRLTEAGLLLREHGDHQDHYFVSTIPLADRQLLRLTQSVSARRLLVALLEAPDRTIPDLVERTTLSPGRLSVHLHRYLETGIVRSGRKGRLRTFDVVDRERAIRLLIAYRAGPADEWIERLLASWADLFRP